MQVPSYNGYGMPSGMPGSMGGGMPNHTAGSLNPGVFPPGVERFSHRLVGGLQQLEPHVGGVRCWKNRRRLHSPNACDRPLPAPEECIPKWMLRLTLLESVGIGLCVRGFAGAMGSFNGFPGSAVCCLVQAPCTVYFNPCT